MIRILQWILGVSAGLSLVFSVIFKLIFNTTRSIIFSTTPSAFLQFTATCCLASIALSMIQLSSRPKE
jgi:hypothetical protein